MIESKAIKTSTQSKTIRVSRNLFLMAAAMLSLLLPAAGSHAALGNQVAAEPAAPTLFIAEANLDAGVVTQGEVLDLEYSITNRGGQPLTIDARPSCGCTVADYDRTIAPGESGTLKARIDTAGFTGPVTKSIMLRTNDPETPTRSLTMRLDVRQILELVPKPMIRLGRAGASETTAKVVLQATGADGTDFAVTALQPAQPYVKATAHRIEGTRAVGGHASPRYEIRVALAEDAPKGFLNVPVTILTDHPKARSVQLRVIGTVTDS